MNHTPRHAGLDPASTFFFLEASQEGGPRIKSGVTSGTYNRTF